MQTLNTKFLETNNLLKTKCLELEEMKGRIKDEKPAMERTSIDRDNKL